MTDIYDLQPSDDDDEDLNLDGLGWYGMTFLAQDGITEADLGLFIKHLNFDESQAYGSTGTGRFNPFLNLNGASTLVGFNLQNNSETENTANGTHIKDPNTNAIQLNDIPISYLDLDGDGDLEAYYIINLDINENNASDVALSELQIFVSGTQATFGDYIYDTNQSGLAFSSVGAGQKFQLVFDLDSATTGGDKTLVLDDQGAGQGKQDYIFYIPTEMFEDAGATGDSFMTLFSQFGPTPPDDAGFAEWNTIIAPKVNGIKFWDQNQDGLQGAGETGLAGFTMFIDIDGDGLYDKGELTAVSGVGGAFEFNSLIGAEAYKLYEILSDADLDQINNTFSAQEIASLLPDVNDSWILTTGVNGAHTITPVLNNKGELLSYVPVKVGNFLADPSLSIVKSVLDVGGDGAGGTVDDGDFDGAGPDGGDVITYKVVVTNTGNQTLTNVVVADPLTGLDLNIGSLDPGEVWDSVTDGGLTLTYEAQQSDIDTNGGGDGDIDNTATADSDQTDEVEDSEEVPVEQNPAIDVEKLVSINDDVFDPVLDDHDSPTGPQATTANTPIYFLVSVANTGNMTLTGLDFSDELSSPAGSVYAGELDYTDPAIDAWVDLDGSGTRDAGEDWATVDGADGAVDGVLDTVSLAPGETLEVHYTMPFEAGQHINTVTVSTDQGVSESDAAHYFGLVNPGSGVRTPGFWQNPNNGGTFWDGIANNQAHDGPDFPDGDPNTEGNQDLLYAVDSDGKGQTDGSGNVILDPIPNDSDGDGSILDEAGAAKVGLLIGDYNRNGVTDGDEDTIFISLKDAQIVVNASSKNGNDVISKIGRDAVAAWLNYLAGNDIGDGSDGTAMHYLDDAIDWLQSFADKSSNVLETGETFDTFNAGSRLKTNSAFWQDPQGDSDHSGADIHNALAEYNESGTVNGLFIAGDGDSAVFQSALLDALNEGLFSYTPLRDDTAMLYDQSQLAMV
jgi:uncharacterized repeat protein (TIGR01451 family)